MNNAATSIRKFISTFFAFEQYGTTLHTELIAGFSTYLTVAYIFIVNPAILATAKIDPSAVLFATVCASALATFVMGFWANLPFAVAPGLSMNAFFAFVVCGILGETWQEGLGTVFISGLLCIAMTAVGVRKHLILSIPHGLKQAISTSVGIFVGVIGLYIAHIVSYNDRLLDIQHFSFAALFTPYAYVLYATAFISLILGSKQLRFPGGMIVAIFAGAVLCYIWGLDGGPVPNVMANPFQAVGQLDLSVLLRPAFWSPILVFFILDFMEGIGEIIGLTSRTTIQDKDGDVSMDQFVKGLYVDGAGTMFGSLLGTSSLIIFVESAVGIRASRRTGFTAITCASLMALSIFFAPLLPLVPPQAAAGVLLYVGYLLLPSNLLSTGDDRYDWFDIAVSSVMGLVVFFTFSLDKAMAVGFWSYFVRSLKRREVQPSASYWLGAIATTLTISIVWQLLIAR